MPPKGHVKGHAPPGKRSTFTVEAKFRVIKEHDSHPGLTKTALAKKLNISRSSLNLILKTRKKTENEMLMGGKGRKKIKKGMYDRLEQALVHWIHQARNLPVKCPLRGPDLKIKALQLAGPLGYENFTASDGWLSRFRKRHKVLFRSVAGEAADVDEETVEVWKTAILPRHLKGYKLRDIYNVDEFGLYVNMLPDKTMCIGTEQAVGNKGSKFRVSVLLGSNADGTDKLKPLVIGKSKKPRCFVGTRTLPCTYTHQESAWMTSEIFKDFLAKFDTRMRIERRKVVMFVDNAPTHPADIELQNVKLVFFPKNTTSKLQPMDQGVIKNVKHHYRVRLVTRLLNFIGRDNVQKKDMYINLLQGLHYLVWAWNQVKNETVLRCFQKAAFREVGEEEVLPEAPQLEEAGAARRGPGRRGRGRPPAAPRGRGLPPAAGARGRGRGRPRGRPRGGGAGRGPGRGARRGRGRGRSRIESDSEEEEAVDDPTISDISENEMTDEEEESEAEESGEESGGEDGEAEASGGEDGEAEASGGEDGEAEASGGEDEQADSGADEEEEGHDDNQEDDEEEPFVPEENPLSAEVSERWPDVCRLFGIEDDLPFDRYVRSDDDLPVYQELSLDDLSHLYQEQGEEEAGEEQADDFVDDELPPVTLAQGLESLEVVRRLVTQSQVNEDVLALLSRLEQVILLTPKTKQSDIRDYFMPL
ncbi:Tigger transposable element-derived protein 4 [Frankliniella fusca]|uniref:Tigger transposable element-derived protein 4 n=1 Tax=Frankliniella fusca TaxID=407009 RepID=A0AAE1LU28_9NEOP|nr:Tigger transposable element-derived protein 4 [Frankliniella fusca]